MPKAKDRALTLRDTISKWYERERLGAGSEWAEDLRRQLEADPSLISTRFERDGTIWRPAAEGGTALHVAVSKGATAAVRILLEHGADPNARFEGSVYGDAPLHLWAREAYRDYSANFEIPELLLAGGADVNARDGEGHTPLCGGLSMSRGQDTAHAAAKMTTWLIEHGADVNIPNSRGLTPREIARAEFRTEAPEVLALIEERSGPPTTVVAAARQGDADSLAKLLRKGGDPNEESDGLTALHHAVRSNRVEAVRVLLGNGARVDAPDSNGWTPLHDAAWRGNTEVVRSLLQSGADSDIRESLRGMAASDMARERGYSDVVSMLRTEVVGKESEAVSKEKAWWRFR